MPDATLIELLKEGCEKADALDFIARAKNHWFQEVLNDLWLNRGESWDRRMKTLSTTSITVLQPGQTRYAMPTDFDSEISLDLFDWSTAPGNGGTAQGASDSTHITLASDERITAAQAMGTGQFIVLGSGTGSGQVRAVSAYNPTTKIATISPAWTTTPDSTSAYSFALVPPFTATAGSASTVTLSSSDTAITYQSAGAYICMLSGTSGGQYRQIISFDPNTFVATVDLPWDVGKIPVSGDEYMVVGTATSVPQITPLDTASTPLSTGVGKPNRFFKYNDELYTDRPPDRVYVMRLRYYANPTKIDYTEGTGLLFTKILTNWRHVLVQGLYVKALEAVKNYKMLTVAKPEFEQMRNELLSAETPQGGEPSQISIDWYYTAQRNLMLRTGGTGY